MVIVTPSKWLKELTDKSFLSSYNSIVINNGINLNVFKHTEGEIYNNLKGLNKKIILGVASTWTSKKGMNDFLTLAKEIPTKYQIVLVGISQEEINNDRIIAYKRTTNQKELAEIYSAADVFVNPTIEENFPTVNLESLACGTPIVTYRTGGSPESVDENTGITVEKGNYQELKNAVMEILEKGKEHYSDACIEKSKSYDMKARFNDYVDLYKEILKQ